MLLQSIEKTNSFVYLGNVKQGLLLTKTGAAMTKWCILFLTI